MATQLQIRRGTSAQVAAFTGAEGEVVVNTTNDSIHVNDGSTAGGFELARVDGSNWAITNNISTTADISFGDNDKAIFGAGSDLQIYHDGSHSYVSDQGTGNLRVLAENFQVRNPANNEAMIIAIPDSGVTLYHDNSSKLATTSTGIDVTGSVTADGLTVDSGNTLRLNAQSTTDFFTIIQGGTQAVLTADSPDGAANMLFKTAAAGVDKSRMEIASGGDISFYEDTGTTAKFFWDASAESLRLGTVLPQTSALFSPRSNGTNIEFGHGNRTSGYFGTLGASANNGKPYLGFSAYADGGSVNTFTTEGFKGNVIEGDTAGNLTFNQLTNANASGQNLTERMRIDASGRVGIGTDNPSETLQVKSTNNNAILLNAPANRYNSIGFQSAGTNKWWLGRADSDQIAGDAFFIGTDAGNATDAGGLSAKVVIDSSGNVGIGTSSPASLGGGSLLTVDKGSSDNIAHFEGNGSTHLRIGETSGAMYLNANNGVAALAFQTNGSERMRIDSSGNLLVGTTSAVVANSASNVGTAIGAGLIESARAGVVAQFNRHTSDGTIADFQKNGSSVGSINSIYGDIVIGNAGTVGIRFDEGVGLIPWDMTANAGEDAQHDIGASSARYKDLYLSNYVKVDANRGIRSDGALYLQSNASSTTKSAYLNTNGDFVFGTSTQGIYLGGTSSANKLDDYEEGTWTPVYTGTSGVATYSTQNGTYTKVGRVVHFAGRLQAAKNTLSGPIDITGLPFTATEDGSSISIGFGSNFTNLSSTDELRGYITGTQIELRTQLINTTSAALDASDLGTNSSDNYIYFSGFYTAA